MNKATRKAIIAGHWKMTMTPSEAAAAVKKTAELVAGKDGCEVVLCVPFVDIAAAIEAASSGREVPQAMRVSEITASLMPSILATWTAFSTKRSQLKISTARPAITVRIAFQSGASGSELFCFSSCVLIHSIDFLSL